MGDTVLFEDEVTAAMTAALDDGLNVTAPTTISSSINRKCISCTSKAKARLTNWAGAVRKVYDTIKQPRAANPQPKNSFGDKPLPDKNSISAAPLTRSSGRKVNRRMEW